MMGELEIAREAAKESGMDSGSFNWDIHHTGGPSCHHASQHELLPSMTQTVQNASSQPLSIITGASLTTMLQKGLSPRISYNAANANGIKSNPPFPFPNPNLNPIPIPNK